MLPSNPPVFCQVNAAKTRTFHRSHMHCLFQLQRGLTIPVLSPVDFLCTNLLLKHCRTINVWESGNIRNTCMVFPVAVTPQYHIGSKEGSNALVLSLAKICPSQESSLRSCWGSLLLWQRSSCSYFSTEGKYWLKVTVLAYFQDQLFSMDLCKE